jgi:uncharacterized protein YjbI with pentapeptide repeats
VTGETESLEAVRSSATNSIRRCQVEMLSGRCDCQIYSAPEHDEEPACLLHSRDPQKSDSEFQQEFERVLKEATDRNEVADFTRFIFPSAQYAHREFKTRCRFDHATFTQKADFSDATFTNAIFSDATFTRNAIFDRATFMQIGYFYGATFTQEAEAYFCRATFIKGANFENATFAREAYFLCAEFTQEANFENATFAKEVFFNQAKFLVSAAFRETVFRGDRKLEPETDDTLPGPVFSLAQFSHPEAVVFYKTYLGQALFLNCDVSGVTFSSVTWRKRKRGGKSMVLEEQVSLNRPVASDLRPGSGNHDERDYRLIAELYQQLKKNYDDHKDYWTAGDFHYGEMEMKRRHSRWRSKLLRWLSDRFSLAAWYRHFSAYGESYWRPFLWLLFFVLALFPFLYPVFGLEFNPPSSAAPGWLGYIDWATFFRMHPAEHPSGFSGMILHSLMTSLSVAGFQRELRYVPSYPWGRMMALFELLLTTTLGGLFLLAIRRQFKR